jgi:hypothetical protein
MTVLAYSLPATLALGWHRRIHFVNVRFCQVQVSCHRRAAALWAETGTAAGRWLLLGAVGVLVDLLAFCSSMDLAGIAVGNVVSIGAGPVLPLCWSAQLCTSN